jgi:hypothetical protein
VDGKTNAESAEEENRGRNDPWRVEIELVGAVEADGSNRKARGDAYRSSNRGALTFALSGARSAPAGTHC